MSEAIITMANITINKDSNYPIQIILDIFLYDNHYGQANYEIIYFDITETTACELADFLSEYNDQFIFVFESGQRASHHVHWVSSDIVSFSVGFYGSLEHQKYQLSSMCAKELSSLIHAFIYRSDKSLIDIDPMARAKRRIDDNLRKFFGYE